jgi:hypothetical protein
LGAVVAPQALSFGAVQGAAMVRGAEARAAMVAAADLGLAGGPKGDIALIIRSPERPRNIVAFALSDWCNSRITSSRSQTAVG